MSTEFTPIASTTGGILLGVAAAALLALNGRVAGISGILGGFIEGREGWSWRGLFLAGMVLGGWLLSAFMPTALPGAAIDDLGLMAGAGLLVGFGTRLGGGCTSGHGVCGISRLSNRSVIATLIFFTTAMLTTFMVRHVLHLEGLGS